jgi:voltage-gated potassium channel
MSAYFIRVANSPGRLLLTFLIAMALSSAAYASLEDASLADGLYWAIVTATTLGYGDFSPHTALGKALTSVLIGSTVFIFIPTITANLASKLIVNRDAFTHEEQEQIKDDLAEVKRLLSEQADPRRRSPGGAQPSD